MLERFCGIGYNRAAEPMSLDPQKLRHVSRLARVALSDDELARLAPQLDSILTYVAQIAQVDVSGVDATAHTLPLHNVLREDTPARALSIDEVLLNAPQTDGRFFKVPKVIGGSEDSAG